MKYNFILGRRCLKVRLAKPRKSLSMRHPLVSSNGLRQPPLSSGLLTLTIAILYGLHGKWDTMGILQVFATHISP
jgi:hypothetical protein